MSINAIMYLPLRNGNLETEELQIVRGLNSEPGLRLAAWAHGLRPPKLIRTVTRQPHD